jgi:hypothetical protein
MDCFHTPPVATLKRRTRAAKTDLFAGSTVDAVTKLALFLYCHSLRSKNSQIHVLWQDQCVSQKLLVTLFISSLRAILTA